MSLIELFIWGFGAGVAATAPMTALMLLAHRFVPAEHTHSLPPRKITAELFSRAHVGGLHAWRGWAFILHFLYGGLTGAVGILVLYSARVPLFAGALVYGIIVWLVGYMGILPLFHLYPSALKDLPSRNILMISAHLVWGASLALLIKELPLY